MKKTFLLTLLAVILRTVIFAQPLFTVDSLIDSGRLLFYKQAFIEGGFGSMGMNQQWSFPFFENNDGIILQLANYSEFPDFIAPQGTNKVLIKLNENGEPINDPLNFFKANNTGLEQLTIRADGSNYSMYSSPYNKISFPVTYDPDQTLFTTSVTFTEFLPFSDGDSIRTHRTISLNYSVPGSGNIILPENNYDVLVIQRLETVTDSFEVYSQGNWTSFPPETYFNEFYDFLSPSLGYYVMMAELVEGMKGTAYQIYYLNDVASVGTDILNDETVVVYPNPADEYFSLNGGNFATNLLITDLKGKVVLQQKINQNPHVNISHLPSGFYHITLPGRDKALHQKLIIQH